MVNVVKTFISEDMGEILHVNAASYHVGLSEYQNFYFDTNTNPGLSLNDR